MTEVLLTWSSKQLTKSMDASPTKTASKIFKYSWKRSSDGSPKKPTFKAGLWDKPCKGLQSEGLSPKSRTCAFPSRMKSGTNSKAWTFSLDVTFTFESSKLFAKTFELDGKELQLSPRLVSEVPEDLQTPLRKARPIDQSNEKSHPCDLSRGRCSLLRRLERNGSVCAVHWGYERSRKTDAKPQPVWQGHCHSVPSVLPLKYCSTHPVLERFAVLREGDQMYPNDEAWYHDIGLQAYHLCQNKSSTSVFCRPLEHQKRWLLKCV